MNDTKKVQRIQGTVVRVSNPSTIRVSTRITKVHPLYRKRYTLLRHYVAHDPKGESKVGDAVTIVSCRPISKTKHWIVQSA